jgi:hypothetical protein
MQKRYQPLVSRIYTLFYLTLQLIERLSLVIFGFAFVLWEGVNSLSKIAVHVDRQQHKPHALVPSPSFAYYVGTSSSPSFDSVSKICYHSLYKRP